MIPKIIWQTHSYLFEDLPLFAKAPMLSWIEQNKDYTHNYVNHFEKESFIYDTFGEDWLKLYNQCQSKVFQADMWRILCLYEYGGIYADIDTLCLEGIDSFIDLSKDFVCEAGFPKTHGWINSSIIASKPKGKFITDLKNLIYERCKAKNGGPITIEECGPLAYSLLMDRYIDSGRDMSDISLCDHNFAKDNKEPVLQIFASVTWNDVKEGFDFSYLNEIYSNFAKDSKTDIKIYTKKSHGGWNA